ncbi:MAG: glycosyltransferase [Proteobacteria bacterium]|nr:glycosyltransferase [Pseudomonadota bacterium]
MKVSVVVCTYNAPELLDLVFYGMSRQSHSPDEMFVADDGSTDDTRRLIASWAERLSFPVDHVWHVDHGYRKTRIVNEAVRRSSGDHLIFLDGDTIPHSRWVEDHALAADGLRVLCGRRVRLGPEITSQITREWVLEGRLESLWGPVPRSWLRRDTKRFLLGIRLAAGLARMFHPRARKLMGVNFSLPKAVFEAVNGYDESYSRAWREDYDLDLRLQRAGYPYYALLNRAIVYHLDHPQREFSPEIEAIHGEHERASDVRCAIGLDAPFDPNE